MSNDSKDSLVEVNSNVVKKNNQLKGMRMRDEFICPITYALMREPIVAMDGHTYEKNAIEKWLKSNHTSPRSGEPMEPILIPNINLKKLITDLLNEGGEGFYTKDISNVDRIFEYSPERILILECLGPPESDWNQQSFEVHANGVIGGRKHNTDEGAYGRETVIFKDITVSRRHFEIIQQHERPAAKQFYLRDLGSAGGTFIRIMYGTKKQLHAGMIILLGKHQFTVSSIDDGGLEGRVGYGSGAAVDSSAQAKGTAGGGIGGAMAAAATGTGGATGLLDPNAIRSLVANAEKIIEGIKHGGGSGGDHHHHPPQAQLAQQLFPPTTEAAAALGYIGSSAMAAAARSDEEELSARLRSIAMELQTQLSLQEQRLGGGGGSKDQQQDGGGEASAAGMIEDHEDSKDNKRATRSYRDQGAYLTALHGGLLGETVGLGGGIGGGGGEGKDSFYSSSNGGPQTTGPQQTPSRFTYGGGGSGGAGDQSQSKDNLIERLVTLPGGLGGGSMTPVPQGGMAGGPQGGAAGIGGGQLPSMMRRCTLTCCAPDGSPLQGKSFVVGREGAMMGRKASNAIALLMKMLDPNSGEERVANVDTAISSEHARVEYDERDGGRFFICDGTIAKPSTNGTWFRLSGPHQESPPHLLQSGTEVLIGTVRFMVKESMTIAERKLDHYSSNSNNNNNNNNSNSQSLLQLQQGEPGGAK